MAIRGGDTIKLLEPENMEKKEQQQSIFDRFKKIYRATRRQNFIKNQMERISTMTLCNMVNDSVIEILIFRYLMNEHPLGLIEMKSLWRCYRISEQILWNTDLINDRETIEELLHLCPPIIWEHDISMLAEQSKKHKNHKHICIMMKKLMEECLMDMECTSSYHCFYTDIAFRASKIQKYLGKIYDDREFCKENNIPVYFEKK